MDIAPTFRRLSKTGLFVSAAILLYAIVLCIICAVKYRNFEYGDFDLAIHSQTVWNIIHGNSQSSVLGIPFLGNHMVLILYLVAPLYWLWSSPLLLLFLQSIILALGAWGVYRLATMELGDRWGAIFAILYLVYPPLIFMNLYEFHPVALATTFLIFALLFYGRDRFGPYFLMLLLALLCQENLSLILIGFAAYACLNRRRGRWIWGPLLTGTIYLAVVVVMVMPRLNQVVQMYSMYGYLGSSFGEVVVNATLHPGVALKNMLHAEKISFFNLLLAPLGYISLLSPTSFVPAFLVAVQRLLSARLTESVMLYHYQAEFIPFVFAAAIHALHRLLSLHINKTLVTRAVAIIMITFSVLGLAVTLAIPAAFRTPRNEEDRWLTERKRAMVLAVPPTAAVASTFAFLSPLANRSELYSLHHIYMGKYTLSSVQYPMPARLDYVLLDVSDPFLFGAFYNAAGYKNLQAILAAGKWEIADQVSPLLALRKVSDDVNSCPQLVRYLDAIPSDSTTNVTSDNGTAGFKLVAYDLGEPDSNLCARLTLYWETSREPISESGVLLTIETEAEGIIYHGVIAPGNRIWPPQSWPAGKIIADKQIIRLKARTESGVSTSLKAVTLR